MLASVAWLNRLIASPALPAEQVEHLLMDGGLPIETRETLANGDVRLDVEITSNRGDCLCHVGLARELAAKTGKALRLAAVPPIPTSVGASPLTLSNSVNDVCPRFTARVIRNVKVGASPSWLREALESIGQRSINNVVDATNFVAAELGNPSHVFDFDRLAGASLIVRWARDGEKLRTLDGKDRVLHANELVVADAERAQSLAGVIGGGESEVTAHTRTVVVEVATWDPVTIRRAARRLGIRTEAGHRFERIVDARTLDAASNRLCSLILEVAGGEVVGPMLDEGRPTPPRTAVEVRPARVNAILGTEVPIAEIVTLLSAVGIDVVTGPNALQCTIPVWRPDVSREIDVIEEIARLRGLHMIPLRDTLPVRVKPPQTRERAMVEAARVLTGLGFHEAITFSFTEPRFASLFEVAGVKPVNVSGERRAIDPTLRPSVLAGLLACRRANEDAGNRPEGGVRLFETASVFGDDATTGASIERRNVALLADAGPIGSKASFTDRQAGYRRLRGSVESLVRSLAGTGAKLEFAASAPPWIAHDPAATASVTLDGSPLGVCGLISDVALKTYGIETALAGAEISLDTLINAYPPRSSVRPLPGFPAIARDISFIVRDEISWAQVAAVISAAPMPHFERLEFVTTFRGPQVGAGRKSVTARVHFRDPARTLRSEEADAQVAEAVDRARHDLGAEIRSA